jgi:hypothetical protein
MPTRPTQLLASNPEPEYALATAVTPSNPEPECALATAETAFTLQAGADEGNDMDI